MRLPSPVIIVITRSLPSNEIQVQNTHSLANNRCSLKVMLHTFKFLGHPFSKVSWHKGFIKITLGIVCHSKSPLGAPVFWGSLKQGNTQCWPSTHTHTHTCTSLLIPITTNRCLFSFLSFLLQCPLLLPSLEGSGHAFAASQNRQHWVATKAQSATSLRGQYGGQPRATNQEQGYRAQQHVAMCTAHCTGQYML